MDDWVRGRALTVPLRTPAHKRQLQFHWGKPPPAEDPRTWTRTVAGADQYRKSGAAANDATAPMRFTVPPRTW
jgi:hypothetical protein